MKGILLINPQPRTINEVKFVRVKSGAKLPVDISPATSGEKEFAKKSC